MRRFGAHASLLVGIVLGACGTVPTAPPPSLIESAARSEAPTTFSPAATATASASGTAEPDPLAWSRADAGGPAAREDHTWTVDGKGETAYLFGGRDGTTVFGDTWAFDIRDESWAQLAPEGAPPPRFGHEAAWVDEIGLVVFAGQSGPTAFFNDLWAYDPAANRWSELPAGGAKPTARYGSCAAVGPDGRLWVSHGFTEDGTRFSDTRAYDFAIGTWTDETPAESRPVERCLHGCWWTEEGSLALYAGQTTGTTALDDLWLLTDGAWSRVDVELPPARNLYARARLGPATLIFGGQGTNGTFQDDLWLLADEAAGAVALHPMGDGPAARAGGELIVDVARERALLFGGHAGAGAMDDLWILTGL